MNLVITDKIDYQRVKNEIIETLKHEETKQINLGDSASSDDLFETSDTYLKYTGE